MPQTLLSEFEMSMARKCNGDQLNLAVKKQTQKGFRYRESNPGLLGESQLS